MRISFIRGGESSRTGAFSISYGMSEMPDGGAGSTAASGSAGRFLTGVFAKKECSVACRSWIVADMAAWVTCRAMSPAFERRCNLLSSTGGMTEDMYFSDVASE